MTYGMFIDYEFCSGCHTCEVACQKELGLRPDEFGIECKVIGPHQLSAKYWQMDNLPVPTDLCNACATRLEKGKLASCVQHCQADCMRVGDIVEMAKLATGKHQVVFTLMAGLDNSKKADGFRGEPKPAKDNYFDTVPVEHYEVPEVLPYGTLSKNSLLLKILKNEKAAKMFEELQPGFTTDPQITGAAAQGVTFMAIVKSAPDKFTDEVVAFIDHRLRELTGAPCEPWGQGPAGLNQGSKLKTILANPQAVAILEKLDPGCTEGSQIKMAAKLGATLEDVHKKAPEKMNETALAFLDMLLRNL